MKTPKFKSSKFSKKIVVICIIIIVLYTIAQLYLTYQLGAEPTPTLTPCVYAFFGTEMAAIALVRIFDREDKKDDREYEKQLNENEKTEI